jgi:hypothetical protein
MAFGIDTGKMDYHDLLRALRDMDEPSFNTLEHAIANNTVGFTYGRRLAGALTPAIMENARHERQMLAKRSTPTPAEMKDLSWVQYMPHQVTTPIRRHESEQEQKMRRRAEAAEQELAALKAKFESLFSVPAEVVSTQVSADPSTPGQWRIRLHVEAFTVETTMGAVTAARAKPGMALGWGDTLDKMTAMQRVAQASQFQIIANHIISGDHKMTSAEPTMPNDEESGKEVDDSDLPF